MALIRVDRFAEAERYLTQVREDTAAVRGADHPAVAYPLLTTAELLLKTGRLGQTDEALRRAQRLNESDLVAGHVAAGMRRWRSIAGWEMPGSGRWMRWRPGARGR